MVNLSGMRKALLLALLCLPWCQGSKAETFPFRVETFPPGASLHDQFGGYLGKSGEDFVLQWDRANGPLQLTILLPRHETSTSTLTVRDLQKGRYPERERLRLQADSFQTAFFDVLRYEPTTPLGVLFALGILGWLGRFLLRRASSVASPFGGHLIGEYRVVEQIGQGGMSEVYRAHREGGSLLEPIAVKVMHLELADSEEASERFRREVRANLAVKHPNLPLLIDWGEQEDGRLYLVMELLEGESLKERLKRERVLPDQVVAEILGGVSAALEHLHQLGFVHRDVKPSNVFCLTRGGIKLTDMGIVQDQALAPLTRTGMVVGTPHYMAPEQIAGAASAFSDQYSMGVMAFEMLAGRRPFVSNDAQELLRQQVAESPPDIADFRPNASRVLREALQRVLCKNPKGRYPDIEAAAAAIRAGLIDACSEDTLA